MSSTSVSPGAGTRLRRRRRGIAVAGIVLIAALLLGWLGRGSTRGYLDPDAYNDAGSRAVAALLAEQGVNVTRVTRTADAVTALQKAPSSGLLITVPDLLVSAQVDDLVRARPSSVVLVAPGSGPALQAFTTGVQPVGANSDDEVLDPACDWGPAVRAGRADAGGSTYLADGDPEGGTTTSCYLVDGQASVVFQEPTSGPSVTVLGDPRVLQNDALAREGNAALAVNALGSEPGLVWFLPSLGDTPDGQASFLELAPDWVPWAIAQLGVAVVVLAAARLRRFGPVIAEPLPIVVPGAETVEGRGRMYRRAGARVTAAAALRASALDDVITRCGLSAGAAPDTVIDAATRRTSRTYDDVGRLLFGPAPTNDAELIALATALRTFNEELA